MQLDLDRVICDFHNVPIKMGDKPLTLKEAIITALLSPDNEISGSEKLKRFWLAKRIFDTTATCVVLGIEEVAVIQQLCGRLYSPLIFGRIVQELERKLSNGVRSEGRKSNAGAGAQAEH